MREDDEDFQNPVDLMFEALEKKDPQHFAVRQYKKYKLAAGKTAKSMHALSICIFVIIYGRMIEIYLMTSMGAIPFATMVNREWGGMGQNYLRAMFALGFQAFLIMVCVGIYAVLVQSIAIDEDIIKAVWTCVGYTVLLCFSLFKTSSMAKSLFNAH